MQGKVRSCVVVMAVGMLLLGLSGVTGSSEKVPPKPASITYLNMGGLDGDPGIARAIAQWEKKTGIKVNVLEMAYPPVYDKTVTVLSSGDPSIDVLAGSDWWTQDFAAAGWLEPLTDERIAEAVAMYPKDIQESAMFDGRIYGPPGGNMLQVFYYRTDLLRKAGYDGPPKTWDELVEIARKVTADTNNDGVIDQWGIVFAGLPEWELGHLVQTLIHQANGRILTGNRVTLNSEIGINALQFVADLRNKHKVAPPGVNTYGSGDVLMAFKSGKAAMAITSTFMIKELDAPGSPVKGNWAVANVPVWKGGRPSTAYITTPLTLNRASKNKYWAQDFIAHYTSVQGQIEEMIYEPGNVALMPDAYDHPLVKNPPADALSMFGMTLSKWKEVMAVLKEAAVIAEVEHYQNQEQIDRLWWTEANKALGGGAAPKDALNHAAARITTLLKVRPR